jgi:3-oxoisoapionate decarboxylase
MNAVSCHMSRDSAAFMNMNRNLTRRKMPGMMADALPSLPGSPLFGAEGASRRRLGIGMHSYGFHWRAAQAKQPQARFSDALEFLEYAHRIGAGGVQVAIRAGDRDYAARLRAKADALGMYFEGQLALPSDREEVDRFARELRLAREAGATVVRTACLSGRRYETFDSAEAFREFRARSWRSLTLAEPILRRHRVRLAVENHKDWLVPELLEWLERISSEHVGVCVDTGNSIALLEDPIEVVRAYAPFAASSHLKDMAVQEDAQGFLLSEVPLGEGFLDLREIVSVLAQANPQLQFNLEMITRDPLRVPCLTDNYWATMKSTPGRRLAEALARVRRNHSARPLPQTSGLSLERQLALEDHHVRQSLAFAQAPV